MCPLSRGNFLKERSQRTCQSTGANYEVDQMGYFRLQLFREYLFFR